MILYLATSLVFCFDGKLEKNGKEKIEEIFEEKIEDLNLKKPRSETNTKDEKEGKE